MKENPDKGYLKAVVDVLKTDGNAIIRTKDINNFLKKLEKLFGIKAIPIPRTLPENQCYVELMNPN